MLLYEFTETAWLSLKELWKRRTGECYMQWCTTSCPYSSRILPSSEMGHISTWPTTWASLLNVIWSTSFAVIMSLVSITTGLLVRSSQNLDRYAYQLSEKVIQYVLTQCKDKIAECRIISILRKNRTRPIFSHRDHSRVVNQRTIIWPQEIFSCWNKATIPDGAKTGSCCLFHWPVRSVGTQNSLYLAPSRSQAYKNVHSKNL